MTKAEFREQFKRLRISGYRLPVFDGVAVDDVLTEWYGTFGACSLEEFSEAIDRLKKHKADTFWPATGEIWQHVYEVRKARRIRLQAQSPDYTRTLTPAQSEEFLTHFRDFRKRLLTKMAMPDAEPQTEPDHVLRERDDQESA